MFVCISEDVVSVAKMVQKFDRWKSFYQTVEEKEDVAAGGALSPDAADQSSLRAMNHIVSSLTMATSEESASQPTRSSERSAATLTQVGVAQRRSTMRFLSFVTSSVSVLTRLG